MDDSQIEDEQAADDGYKKIVVNIGKAVILLIWERFYYFVVYILLVFLDVLILVEENVS